MTESKLKEAVTALSEWQRKQYGRVFPSDYKGFINPTSFQEMQSEVFQLIEALREAFEDGDHICRQSPMYHCTHPSHLKTLLIICNDLYKVCPGGMHYHEAGKPPGPVECAGCKKLASEVPRLGAEVQFCSVCGRREPWVFQPPQKEG